MLILQKAVQNSSCGCIISKFKRTFTTPDDSDCLSGAPDICEDMTFDFEHQMTYHSGIKLHTH